MFRRFYINSKNEGHDDDYLIATLGGVDFFSHETLKDKKDINDFKNIIHSFLVSGDLKETDIGEIGLAEKRIRFTSAIKKVDCFEKIGVKQLYIHENRFIIYEGIIEPLITFNTPKINDKLKPFVLELTANIDRKEPVSVNLDFITTKIRGKEKDIVLVVHPELKTFVLKEKPLA